MTYDYLTVKYLYIFFYWLLYRAIVLLLYKVSKQAFYIFPEQVSSYSSLKGCQTYIPVMQKPYDNAQLKGIHYIFEQIPYALFWGR